MSIDQPHHRYISEAERRALTQYDHFTNIWREIDEGRIRSLRDNQDLPILINDKQKGVTPLFLAVKRKETDMVLLLLANGADPNIICKDASPLWVACYHGLLEVIFPLLDNGADPNFVSAGATPLHVATARGLVEVVSILLNFERGANVNACTSRLGTALHVAVNRGHRFVLESLLTARPDLSTANRFGETVLHLACRMGDEVAINLLLNSKLPIDPMQKDSVNGSTIAHLTTTPKLFKSLLRRWPQLLYANDNHGRSPTYYMPMDVLPLLTSITAKLVEQCGPHLLAEVDRYGDLVIECPVVSTLSQQLQEQKAQQADKKSPSSTTTAPSEAIVAQATAELAQVSVQPAFMPVRIACHRAMMCSRAPGFRALLGVPAGDAPSMTQTDSLESVGVKSPQVLELDYSSEVMHAVVHYCYTDVLKCAKHHLEELAAVANKLGMVRLQQLARGKLGLAVEASESTYATDLASLRVSKLFADVKIIVREAAPASASAASSSSAATTAATMLRKSFMSHKFLLSAFSEYFATMFSAGMREAQSGVVELEDVSLFDLDTFLHWIYTFNIKQTVKTANQIFKMLELSSHFLCPDMALPLQTKLLEMLINEDYKNLDLYITEADRLGAQLLYEQCAAYFSGRSNLRPILAKKLDPEVFNRLCKTTTPRA